eukprot:CAMPEP_0171102944 /NCGR_PEP_ID=MMETSP0766_2-20121228/58649_1 /TAXON_ID=439317 /ORGANISM="Gambierdiscus australes, Strain CAWD 149" /LENGTH=55 /DNA_ID=CAMNT_0011563329 /DNA_START=24 /DNA_END=187 /DNA_ORIENTATION=-
MAQQRLGAITGSNPGRAIPPRRGSCSGHSRALRVCDRATLAEVMGAGLLSGSGIA